MSLIANREWAAFFALSFLVSAGCAKGKTTPKPDLVPVKGPVTLDGQPLADADVSFAFDGTPPAGYYGSGARTDAQGHYELQCTGENGAVPGKYKVTVSHLVNNSGVPIKPEEGIDMEQLRQAGMAKETVPQKYTDAATTDLTTTVDKGKAEGYNFDLKSG